MVTIVVVCGAGASSTFLAHRMNRAAKAAGLNCTARAATLDDYRSRLHAGDALLVGPQLATHFAEISARAERMGVRSALLPETIFGAGSADEALRIATDLIATDPIATDRIATDEQGEHHG